jgi:D-glycero-alpha-D-manno-heptose-7-phosphate kinase
MAIRASAPVRICDIGGWTDTWFGGPGRIVNLAVAPGASVTLRHTDEAGSVLLDVVDFADRYDVRPGATRCARHPLLEACIDALPPPEGLAVAMEVRSAVPPGCGMGTSAAVAVAVLGALAELRSEQWSPERVAAEAHRVETEVLGSESGVQDQLSAALGGLNYIEIDRYPRATVQRLPAWSDLGGRLVVVSLGAAHDSAALHRQVIETTGPGRAEVLARLREAAGAARRAVLAQDLVNFGRAMVVGTDAQRSLLPPLVGADAERVIEVAKAEGALGWKVNGAGGEGGSLTLLADSPAGAAALGRAVSRADDRYRVLPVALSEQGLSVESDSP